MKINIEPFHFEEIIKKGYSLDLIYLLRLIDGGFDLSTLRKESAKVDALYQSLIRKGLISEHEDKITTLGKELLVFIETKQAAKIVKPKPVSTDFEEFWKAYPGTDTFTHAGRTFQGSRSLRVSKDDCRTKFNKILLEGEYSPSQITEAMKYDVLQKKEASVRQGTNKLSYMQNSLTYLNQRSFEPFIELIMQQTPIEVTKSNINTTTDI